MTKFFGLFVAAAAAAFLSAPAFAQCAACAGAPLDCPLKFDSAHVSLPTYTQNVCRASTTAQYGKTNFNSCRRTFEPPFWLVDVSTHELSSNNGSFSISTYASDTDIDFQEEIKAAYQQVKEIAGKYNDSAAQGKIDEIMNNHLNWVRKFKNNKPTVELKVEASGHGWDLDKKRGWQDTAVTATVACVLPVNLKDQLLSHLGIKGDQVALRNRIGKAVYAYHATVDSPTASCASAKNGALIRLDNNQSEVYAMPVANGQAGKLCVHYHNARPDSKDLSFSKSCEYSPGPINEIASLPAQCTN